MTYEEANSLSKQKNQEFIDYCMNNDIESAYGMTPEEEIRLKKEFDNANVYNTNIVLHQNYQNFKIISLNTGLYFVPFGLMACGDMDVLKQIPVTEELKKSNMWSIKSFNNTSIDW